jgi:predicted negative regulator of RcsB-dependent stress response
MISQRLTGRRLLALGALVAAMSSAGSCAPRAPYKAPLPRPRDASSSAARPHAPVEPAVSEPPQKPLPFEPSIREQDLKSKDSKKPPAGSEASRPAPVIPETSRPPLPDDSSLLAKLTPGTSPQRAASLRLTEEGRKLLEAGDPAKALNRLEKSIVIDANNSYGYFYLAKAHYGLGRYKESLNFLDVAESRLAGEPFWLAEVHALRGENFRALGMSQKAEASYTQALRLNSGNRVATDAMMRLQRESQPAPPVTRSTDDSSRR